MGAQRIKPALHRLGGQIPVRGNFSGQLREILLPQSCQQLRRQLSLQQSAVQGVFRRKRLNWKCPAEVFYSVTLHLI